MQTTIELPSDDGSIVAHAAQASTENLSQYRYSVRRLNATSARYGPCEICRQHVSDMCYQMEEKRFSYGGQLHWTTYECNSRFGHEQCLAGTRRENHTVVPLEHMQCGPDYVA